MGYFGNPAEVDRFVGGILRIAAAHAVVAPHLEAAEAVLRIQCVDPDCELTVILHHPMTLVFGHGDVDADVTLRLEADILDQYWRGHYSLLDGLACGQVRAKGQISRILKVLHHVEVLFPDYRESVADKDAAVRSPMGL